MVLKIVNLVDSIEEINAGVWLAAASTAPYLVQQGITSELWYPKSAAKIPSGNGVVFRPLESKKSAYLYSLCRQLDLNAGNTVFVTHGCWTYATRWGYLLEKKGFKWVYTPQGMLEPWPMKHKAWKKAMYFRLFEKPMARRATIVRAVSLPEAGRLGAFFDKSRIRFIPNGIHGHDISRQYDRTEKIRFTFMGRLQGKKGIVPLVNAWVTSLLKNRSDVELVVAGPDEGDLVKISEALGSCSNISYVGRVSGDEKSSLLQKTTFFVLPSLSEGLPTAVLEAMSYGAIPVLTDECNFVGLPENGVGIRLLPDVESIRQVLEECFRNYETIKEQMPVHKIQDYVKQHFSLNSIAHQQATLFSELIAS